MLFNAGSEKKTMATVWQWNLWYISENSNETRDLDNPRTSKGWFGIIALTKFNPPKYVSRWWSMSSTWMEPSNKVTALFGWPRVTSFFKIKPSCFLDFFNALHKCKAKSWIPRLPPKVLVSFHAEPQSWCLAWAVTQTCPQLCVWPDCVYNHPIQGFCLDKLWQWIWRKQNGTENFLFPIKNIQTRPVGTVGTAVLSDPFWFFVTLLVT